MQGTCYPFPPFLSISTYAAPTIGLQVLLVPTVGCDSCFPENSPDGYPDTVTPKDLIDVTFDKRPSLALELHMLLRRSQQQR